LLASVKITRFESRDEQEVAGYYDALEVILENYAEIEKQDMHPLVYIAGFVYEFLSIHPYKDGNGRLSRLLTTLLMMKQGYEFIQYISFENVIESCKDEYYRVLMDG
jgi:Fic family protein